MKRRAVGAVVALMAGVVWAAPPERTAEELQKACDGGQPEDCKTLASDCYSGKGVPEYSARAKELFRKAEAGLPLFRAANAAGNDANVQSGPASCLEENRQVGMTIEIKGNAVRYRRT